MASQSQAVESWTPVFHINGGDANFPFNSHNPVLVLGHSLGSSHIMWDDVVPFITSSGINVITYDLPGHGGTPFVKLSRPLRMDDLIDGLLRGLDGLTVTNFHIAGLSMGGMIALAATHRHSDRILSMSVMSSGPVLLPSKAWVEKAELVRTSGTSAVVETTLERWFTPDFASGIGNSQVARIRREFENCSDEGYAQCCEVISSTDLRSDLSEITLPSLLISGENDGALNWEAAENLRVALGSEDIQLVKLEKVRHMSAVERPQEVAYALCNRVV